MLKIILFISFLILDLLVINSIYAEIYNKSNYNGDYPGQIYLITGTAGRSLYEIKQQAPFVAKQDDKHFGFLNIDINTNNTLIGTFYSNENYDAAVGSINFKNILLDQFTLLKDN
jgi:hypothetical protein